MQTRMKALIAGTFLTAIYGFIYVALSARGSYVPFTSGLTGIKSWAWAPQGFSNGSGGLRLGSPIYRVFYPLWVLDNRLWHSDWTGLKGPRHPAAPPAGGNAGSSCGLHFNVTGPARIRAVQ